jgi:asparagine synthase (glutamine-hydrolysing)
MCGITGFFDISLKRSQKELREIVSKMADTLYHRGPDDSGVWVDEKSGIALGHRRLSIIDLSPAGHQPMYSATGRFVIVFNGEIYNYIDIRKELESEFNSSLITHHSSLPPWRGHSDTEVMLAAFEQWGVEGSVKRFVGMFAFALWDCQEKLLYLVRDRLGEKPLYYGLMGKTFLFASELKAMRVYPDFSAEIDRDALALYLRHNYIPAPYSIFKGIHKLPQGTILILNTKNKPHIPSPFSYWSAQAVAEAGVANPFYGTDAEAIEHLDNLLRDSIRNQMIADVPLGAFLSGGVDSSTVVALMQAQSNRPVRTFTIGFKEEGYNEAEDAKAVAHHLGTEHTELYVTSQEAMAVIPKLPLLYDEPFSDSSQIPTYLVSQMTRQFVKVSLSGDGGDELFAGYNRYFLGRNIWKNIGWIPKGIRSKISKGLTLLSPNVLDTIFSALNYILPQKIKQRNPGDKLHKLSEILAINNPEEMYLRLVSHWNSPTTIVLNASEPITTLTNQNIWANLCDFTQNMMYLDLITYLPDDLLVKVDRAAMGVSLETRVPFLDHRIVEFAWRLPLSMKIRNGQGKWILRQVLYKYVPRDLIERPKMGFGVPIDSWLKGPLREWAESLLNEKRLREEGFFNPQPIQEKWIEHLSGRRNWQYYLWDVLMFQAWLSQNTH